MVAGSVLWTLEQINKAWLDGRPESMLPWIHPDINFVFPGLNRRIHGSEAFLAGFKDFCENARVVTFETRDQHADIVGETAVASLRFEVVYDREGARYRATGCDLWVFAYREAAWVAVWRTMIEMEEAPEDLSD